MPELPEVETVKTGLRKFLPGKKIAKAEFDWPKSFPNSPHDVDGFLVGAKVLNVRRRGKVLIIELDTGYALVIHLKMTGQLVFIGARSSELGPRGAASRTTSHDLSSVASAKEEPRTPKFGGGHPSDSLVGKLPDKSTRVTLTLTDGSKLFFNDQRKFGWMRLLPSVEVPEIDFFKRLGPEPLGVGFQFSVFSRQLGKRKNSVIKAALLDQTVIAGIGNIYADESLWAAGIYPATRVRDISQSKLKILYKEIRRILKLAIKTGGSTDKNYVDAEGKKGSYLKFAKVFRREGQPCERHPDTLIIKTRVAGRGTHFCPKCQKL